MVDVSAIVQAYSDNADYEGDTAKARAYRVACRQLLGIRPDEAQFEDGRFRYNQKLIEAELDRVNQYLNVTGGSRSKHVDLSVWRLGCGGGR